MSWAWADHACRTCGSRLIEHTDTAGKRLFECGSCGAKAHTHSAICGCGVLPERKGSPRFRCIPNPGRGQSSPAHIVIAFDEELTQP